MPAGRHRFLFFPVVGKGDEEYVMGRAFSYVFLDCTDDYISAAARQEIRERAIPELCAVVIPCRMHVNKFLYLQAFILYTVSSLDGISEKLLIQ
jgi:hypothetical protein